MNDIILSLIIAFGIQIFFFIFAATFKTDNVTDLSYGLSFIILAGFFLIKNKSFQITQILVASLVFLWGFRLAGYLLIRILKIKKDKRFDGMRENFIKFAGFWFFQALTVWIISLPVVYLLSLNQNLLLNILTYVGLILWTIGFLIETIADQQKFVFKNKNPKKFIKSGLWKYSRYPNYFGEMLLWWGLFIMVIPYLIGLNWVTIIGPIFITFILLFVSGIPLLEKSYNKKYGNDKEYQEYKKNTSKLIPLFTKNN